MSDSNKLPTVLIRRERVPVKKKQQTVEIPKDLYESMLKQIQDFTELAKEQGQLIDQLYDMLDDAYDELEQYDSHSHVSDDYPIRISHKPGEDVKLDTPKIGKYDGSSLEIGSGKVRFRMKFK